MTLPFDTQQFLAVFATYNQAIWPMQIVAYAAGVLATAILIKPAPWSSRAVLATLALFWAWNGIVYHGLYFTPINPAARLFAALFIVAAILFAAGAFNAYSLTFDVSINWRTMMASITIVYALVIYEILSMFAGHGLMLGPLFGVAPCPTTIFTLGVLMLARGAMVPLLAVIPVLWAALGTSAAILLGIPEDFGLGLSAVICLVVLFSRRGGSLAAHA